MKSFKRDPRGRLRKDYEQRMKDAMLAMRRGDLRTNARLIDDAEQTRLELERLDAKHTRG